MKTLLFLLLSINAFSQTSNYFHYSTGYRDSSFRNEVRIAENGHIEIIGDTMACIKMLLHNIQLRNVGQQRLADELIERYNVELELQKLIDAGVAFANEVPDYYKEKEHNCKWEKYNRLLNKHGYKSRTVKNKKPCQ